MKPGDTCEVCEGYYSAYFKCACYLIPETPWWVYAYEKEKENE